MALTDIFRSKKTAVFPTERFALLGTPSTPGAVPAGKKVKSSTGNAVGGLEVPLPKPGKAGGVAIPSVMKSAKPSTTSAFAVTDNTYASTDLMTLRSTAANSRDLIDKLVQASPHMSASVSSYARVGIPKKFTAIARNMDRTFNRDATILVQAILTRMDYLGNPDGKSFDDSLSIRSICESLTRDLRVYGACCVELVLDKARLPYKIQPISFSQIKLYPTADAKAVTPKQLIAGQIIDLDLPTVFMVSVDQSLLTVYADSPLEPAIQGVMFWFEFINDIRRVIKRAIHPRYDVEIDEEKLRESFPAEIVNDAEKIAEYTNGIVAAIGKMMTDLAPEDAIVHFDTIGITVVDHGNTNLAQEYSTIDGMITSQLTTGTKTLPTVLGLGDATANVASAETLMFMKNVEGAVTFKLNEIISQALTMAVRVMGQDVFVQFEFERVDLRPSLELESFRALEQSRILEQLSLGLISDDEACLILTGNITPDGYMALSGTQFMAPAPKVPAGDGTNGTSNGGSTMNKSLKPNTPTGGARGANQKNGSKAA